MELDSYGVVELSAAELISVNGGNVFTDFLGFIAGTVVGGYVKIGELCFVIVEVIAGELGLVYLEEFMGTLY